MPVNLLRYLSLASGFIIIAWIMITDYSRHKLTLTNVIILLLWIMSPFYLQFFLTMKTESTLKILLPTILLIIIYIIFTKEYFRSDNATAGLVFIAIPLAGFAAVGVGYLLNYLLSLFK